MSRITKTVAAILLLATLCGSLMGCGVTRYGAKLLDGDAEDLINPEFYDENRLYLAHYSNDPSDPFGEQLLDSSFPRTRSFIIRSQEEYNVIFSDEADFKVDFDKKMLVVLTFVTVYKLPVEMATIRLNNEKLFVKLEIISPHPPFTPWGGATLDYQRYVVIEMNHANISDVEFKVKEFGYNFDSFF